MNGYQSLIDMALENARRRTTEGTSEKVASTDDERDLIKEASEVANALEFIAQSSVSDGSVAGELKAELLRNIKQAAAGEPVTPKAPLGLPARFTAEGSTQATGSQGQAPSSSKRKIQPAGTPGADRPQVSEAPEGHMDRNVMAQQPPETKSVPKDKQAGLSLYDVLMQGKTAAAGGPAELDPENAAPGVPDKNENVNRKSILSSEKGIVNATKRQTKQPGRARLAEIFRSANDTVGDETARAIWPQAAAQGEMKVASSIRTLARVWDLAEQGYLGEEIQNETQKTAYSGGSYGAQMSPKDRKAEGALRGAVGGFGGAVGGAVAGGVPGMLLGPVGGVGGAIGGGILGGAHGRRLAVRSLANEAGHSDAVQRRAAMQSTIGGTLGGLAGSIAGATTRVPFAGVAGEYVGERYGTKSVLDAEKNKTKKASAVVSEYSELWEQALSGELGPEAQTEARRIVESLS